MIACRTPECLRIGEPAGVIILGGVVRPVGGPCVHCGQPTDGGDDAVLIVPPPHKVNDGPDHRASAYSATAALLELTTRLDPAHAVALSVASEISVQFYVAVPEAASALAGRLDLTETDTSPSGTFSYWLGSWRGWPVRIACGVPQ